MTEPGRGTPAWSEHERQLLSDSVRGYLARHWAVSAPSAPRVLWRGLASQGLAGLGASLGESRPGGGLGEIVLVMEELGRAACPAPMVGAALLNLWLSTLPALPDAMRVFQQALHRGDVSLGFALGGHDGDPLASGATLRQGRVHGHVAFADIAGEVSHLLLITEEPALAIVEMGASGLSGTPAPGLSVPPLAEIGFEQCAVHASEALDLPVVRAIRQRARLMLAARAWGAARRGFDLAVEHAKMRSQFGRPIGTFQAIQHKLADALTDLEGSRLAIAHAAASHDEGQAEWPVHASAAHAFASPALRRVALRVQHTLGAAGYCEEHEAPGHFRRIHGDLSRLGGPMAAHEELAALLLDLPGGLPDCDLGTDGTFRSSVRAWLDLHWHAGAKARFRRLPLEKRHFAQSDPAYGRALAETGWIAASWPERFGGQACRPLEQLALLEEMQRAGAPPPNLGEIQALALIRFGSPGQQARFLPRIRAGLVRFCLGYSEPGAGSDLAALSTSAVRDGDEWVINGEKSWTSYAAHADYIWLAARTGSSTCPAHAGISLFIVPTDAPGLSIRPFRNLRGVDFCSEVFENVRVPADALVGEVNGGWKILTSALATERVLLGAYAAQVLARFEDLVAHLRQARERSGALRAKHAPVRDRVGELAACIQVARLLVIHSVRGLEQGRDPVCEAAMSKIFTSELMERLGEAALDLGGCAFSFSEEAPAAPADGALEQMLRLSIMMVVGGGTNEIQRNIIARRAIGLPP